MKIFKLVDSLKYLTAVSHRAAASVAIRLREPGPTRAKGRFRQLEEVHCLEIVTFLVDAVVQYHGWSISVTNPNEFTYNCTATVLSTKISLSDATNRKLISLALS